LTYFSSNNDYSRALKLAERLAVLDSSNAQVWLNLAKLYLISGDVSRAQVAVQEAFTLDPKLKTEWETFIKSLASTTASSTIKKGK
jgi:Flp pilus assembly protein TadD